MNLNVQFIEALFPCAVLAGVYREYSMYVKCMWCAEVNCENPVKDHTGGRVQCSRLAMSPRLTLFDELVLREWLLVVVSECTGSVNKKIRDINIMWYAHPCCEVGIHVC